MSLYRHAQSEIDLANVAPAKWPCQGRGQLQAHAFNVMISSLGCNFREIPGERTDLAPVLPDTF
jgi:hypothetical protein